MGRARLALRPVEPIPKVCPIEDALFKCRQLGVASKAENDLALVAMAGVCERNRNSMIFETLRRISRSSAN
jgi:hypothetical protein